MKVFVSFCFFLIGFSAVAWGQVTEKALRDSLQKPHLSDSGKVKALLNLGNFLANTDSIMTALKHMENALSIAEKANMQKWIAASNLTLASLHHKLSNHAEALKAYRLASVGYEKLKMFPQHIHCLQCIGKMHEIQGNYDRALQYYQEALKKSENKKLINQIAFAHNNIGNAYFYKREYPKAIAWQQKAIAIRKKHDSISIQYSYNDIASIYSMMQKHDSALYYLQKAHFVAKKVNDIQLLAMGAINLAGALDSNRRHKEALEIAEKGLSLAQKLGVKNSVSDLTRYLAVSYSTDNLPTKAIEMYELHMAYRDSLASEERTREIAKLETNHEIEKQSQENQKIKAEKEQQRYWLMAALVGVFLLLGVAVMLIRLNNYRRKTNLLLEAKNNELHEKNEEINQQKEELTIIAENLEMANQEINQKNEELTIIAENLEEANQAINQKNEDLTASITYASRIQQAILPALDEIRYSFAEAFVLFHPRDLVSGDFYFFSMVGKECILAVADCTGHGVPGALMSMVGNDLLHEIVTKKQISVPAQILAELHKGIRKALKQHETDNRDGMDIAIINHNKTTQTLQFAGAKNPLVYIEAGKLKSIKGSLAGIGGEQREVERSFENHTLPTQDISWLYMFSDGFQDQFGGSQNKKFGLTRFRELLSTLYTESTENQQKTLLSTFQNWRTEGREKQIDDVLIIGVKIDA